MHALAVLLIALNTPDHQTAWVNPAEVVTLRKVRDSAREHFAAGVKCIVATVDGKFIMVVDPCDDVMRSLGR